MARVDRRENQNGAAHGRAPSAAARLRWPARHRLRRGRVAKYLKEMKRASALLPGDRLL